MEKDLSASAELKQLYMYLASEVRWETSVLKLFQKGTTTTTTKKNPARARDMPLDADTALRPRYYLYNY